MSRATLAPAETMAVLVTSDNIETMQTLWEHAEVGHLRARRGDAAHVDMTSIIHTHAEFGALRVMPPAERSAHRVGCASSMISDR